MKIVYHREIKISTINRNISGRSASCFPIKSLLVILFFQSTLQFLLFSSLIPLRLWNQIVFPSQSGQYPHRWPSISALRFVLCFYLIRRLSSGPDFQKSRTCSPIIISSQCLAFSRLRQWRVTPPLDSVPAVKHGLSDGQDTAVFSSEFSPFWQESLLFLVLILFYHK